MDNLEHTNLIQRQLFRSAGEPERLAGSCVMTFGATRRRGRLWVPLLIVTGTVLLLAFFGQPGIAG